MIFLGVHSLRFGVIFLPGPFLGKLSLSSFLLFFPAVKSDISVGLEIFRLAFKYSNLAVSATI